MLNWLERVFFSYPTTPGPWFLSYHAAWSAEHPGAFMNGTGQAGGFCAGNVWVTSTPEFDKAWFKANGMRRPRKFRVQKYVQRGIPIADVMKPGESRSFTIQGGNK